MWMHQHVRLSLWTTTGSSVHGRHDEALECNEVARVRYADGFVGHRTHCTSSHRQAQLPMSSPTARSRPRVSIHRWCCWCGCGCGLETIHGRGERTAHSDTHSGAHSGYPEGALSPRDEDERYHDIEVATRPPTCALSFGCVTEWHVGIHSSSLRVFRRRHPVFAVTRNGSLGGHVCMA